MVDLGKHLENAAEAVIRRNFALAVKIYAQVLQIQPDYGDARAGLRKALIHDHIGHSLEETLKASGPKGRNVLRDFRLIAKYL